MSYQVCRRSSRATRSASGRRFACCLPTALLPFITALAPAQESFTGTLVYVGGDIVIGCGPGFYLETPAFMPQLRTDDVDEQMRMGTRLGWRVRAAGWLDFCPDGGEYLALESIEYLASPTPTATPTATPTGTRACPACPRTPLAGDADGDQLPDAVEAWPCALGVANALLPDSDGDGLRDGEEDMNHNGLRDAGETDPRDRDSDDDGLLDGIERLLNRDPLAPDPPLADLDGDALPALVDPMDNAADTDGDRFKDGYEAAACGLPAVGDAGRRPPLGDINCDGAPTNLDALMIQSGFLQLVSPLAMPGFGNGDATRDGCVSNLDALAVQQLFLDILPGLPL